MIRGERRRWQTDELFLEERSRWQLLAGLLLWAALYALAILVGSHSYFVIGREGTHIIPQGLFDSEKQFLLWLLHGTFAAWLLPKALGWKKITDWTGRVAIGVAIAFVPAILVMSWPKLLVPFLPAGARPHQETRMQWHGNPPHMLFKGDPVLRRGHWA